MASGSLSTLTKVSSWLLPCDPESDMVDGSLCWRSRSSARPLGSTAANGLAWRHCHSEVGANLHNLHEETEAERLQDFFVFFSPKICSL